MQFQALEAFSFPVITLVHLLFIKYIEHFQGNSKIFAVFFTPCIAIYSRLKRFVMSMQLRQCFARAMPVRLKKKLFENQKMSSALKKARISIKIWLKKANLATLCFDWFITWFTHLRENKWNGTLAERKNGENSSKKSWLLDFET